MTASASLPIEHRMQAAAAVASQATKPTARAAAAKARDVERPPARPSAAKTPGPAPTLANKLRALAFATVVAAVLICGWQMRDEGHLTPESGVGYWLGIAGAMLLLLGYPLRKCLTGLKLLGSVTGSFRLHMMLGVLGPALILLLANFKLGSRNSNVALLAMLIVASGGHIGRYLDSRIHLALYRGRVHIAELQADIAQLMGAIAGEPSLPADVLAANDRHAERRRSGALSSLFTLLRLRLTPPGPMARLSRAAARHIGAEAKWIGWSWRRPLFAILLFAAAIHVVVLIGTPAQRHGALILLGVFLLSATLSMARAQGILEKLVMPGPLVGTHAELEKTCKSCLEPFAQKSQSGSAWPATSRSRRITRPSATTTAAIPEALKVECKPVTPSTTSARSTSFSSIARPSTTLLPISPWQALTNASVATVAM